MNKLLIYKKPLLAVLEQEKKLRDYNEQERLFACKNIITVLLLDLGVGSKSDPQQHLRAIQHLFENCGKYSVNEIKKAFSLAITGKLDIELFQQINILVIGKVLRAFDVYKIEKLKVYRLKKSSENKNPPMSEDEVKAYTKIAAKKQLDYFIENREIDESRIYVYDIFDKLGLMPIDIEYKNSVKKDAIKILKSEYLIKQKTASSIDEFKEIKKILKGLEIGKVKGIKNKCKKLALEDFLRKELKTNEDRGRLLNLLK